MANHAALRKTVLMEIYRQSAGDMDRPLRVAEIAKALNLSANDVVVIVGQLEGKLLARFQSRTFDPEERWSVAITMRGIEEAENMEKPFVKRWMSDHPAVVGVIGSIIGSVTTIGLTRLMDWLFR